MEREYLKKVLYYIVMSALAIGIMIYVGYHMVKRFTSGVETQPAHLDTFTESVTYDAYIIRNESVLRPSAEGTVNYLVSNGEKVRAGSYVADIYRTAQSGLRAEIDALDERIERLKYAEESAAYTSVSDAAKIDARIRETLYSIRRETAGGNIQTVARLADTLLEEMNRRRLATGEEESFEDEILALEAERRELISRMSDVADSIKTDVSAYYFYDTDGYEEIFSTDDIDSVTLDDIARMTSAMPSEDTLSAGKLVYDYKWYAAVPVDVSALDYFTAGASYDVGFDAEGITLSLKLYKTLSESGQDSACLIFECDKMPQGFEYTRMQPISIKINSYAGYRVPASAVRVMKYGDDEVTGVYILYGETVYFRRIEIILTQDGYVLCDAEAGVEEPYSDDMFPVISDETEAVTEAEYESIPYLSLYDMVITSSKGLYDGKIIS